jgi:hypothetical protein
MPRPLRKLRPAPWAMALMAWDLWKRLTPAQRRQVMALVRKHGPTVATKASELRRKRR